MASKLVMVTVCGGLPLFASITGGQDYEGEYWAEVVELRWVKRDGTPGGEVTQKMWDRAHAYSYDGCDIIEQVSEASAYERAQEEPSVMVQFAAIPRAPQ